MHRVDIHKVYAIVKEQYALHRMPIVELIAVQGRNPYQVLVATILSARTKDETTAAACTRLFARAPAMADLARLRITEIEKLIFPVGFYRNKAVFLAELPGAVDRLFGGAIPQTVDELVLLPGVGRKTANLVVSVAFDKPGICVGVHVHRICNRLGYVRTETPFDTEMALRKKLPPQYWITFNSYLVSFGQFCCRPVSPHCGECPLHSLCNRIGVQ